MSETFSPLSTSVEWCIRIIILLRRPYLTWSSGSSMIPEICHEHLSPSSSQLLFTPKRPFVSPQILGSGQWRRLKRVCFYLGKKECFLSLKRSDGLIESEIQSPCNWIRNTFSLPQKEDFNGIVNKKEPSPNSFVAIIIQWTPKNSNPENYLKPKEHRLNCNGLQLCWWLDGGDSLVAGGVPESFL